MLTSANGKLSLAVSSAHIVPDVERRVKYMAKRPAKNINSLDSQTTVPTETRLGAVQRRVRRGYWGHGSQMSQGHYVCKSPDFPMQTTDSGDFFYKDANSRGKVPGLVHIGHRRGWLDSIRE